MNNTQIKAILASPVVVFTMPGKLNTYCVSQQSIGHMLTLCRQRKINFLYETLSVEQYNGRMRQ